MAAITLIHDCDILRRPTPTALNGDFRDTYISGESGEEDTNYNDVVMYIGVVNEGGKGDEYEQRGLFYYDLNAFIPADAIITAASWRFCVFLFQHALPETAPFRIVRIRRTDWKEDEATWNDYKSGSAWTGAGASDTTDDIDDGLVVTLGDLDNLGWYDFDVETLVDDAWDNRSGICTFLMQRTSLLTTTGNVQQRAKEDTTYPEFVHHLRITYTLAGKTFEAFVFDGIPDAAAAAFIPRVMMI